MLVDDLFFAGLDTCSVVVAIKVSIDADVDFFLETFKSILCCVPSSSVFSRCFANFVSNSTDEISS